MTDRGTTSMRAAVVCCLLVLAACGGETAGERDTSAPDAADTAGSAGTTGATTGTTTSRDTPPASPGGGTTAMTLSLRALGPLRIGMTVAQARAVMPAFALPADAGTGCTYASATGLPAGVIVMVDTGVIVRFEVDSGTVTTTEGARVGDSEERIRQLYGARVTSSPHKYTDGRYLTVKGASAADSAYRLVFETDGRRVLEYRSGVRPQVEYVEGCS